MGSIVLVGYFEMNEGNISFESFEKLKALLATKKNLRPLVVG